jgi:hypothetical protein
MAGDLIHPTTGPTLPRGSAPTWPATSAASRGRSWPTCWTACPTPVKVDLIAALAARRLGT